MIEVRNIKTLFIAIFILVFAFTIFGIIEMSKEGGPCNGGLLFLTFMSIFVFCFLFLSISQLYFFRKNKFKASFILGLIPFIIWTISIIFFYEQSSIIMYLMPLELLNLIWLLYILKK